MKILIVSDTHGNAELFCNVLRNEADIDVVLHLGDNWEDVDLCPEELEGVVIHRVPGNFHPGLINKSLKKIVDCNLAGKRFRLIHDLQQLDNHAGCDFILFGHTHASFCEEMKGRIYLNPGHLKKEEDRGHQASYGILTLTEEMMIYENKRYDGRLIYSRSWRSNRS